MEMRTIAVLILVAVLAGCGKKQEAKTTPAVSCRAQVANALNSERANLIDYIDGKTGAYKLIKVNIFHGIGEGAYALVETTLSINSTPSLIAPDQKFICGSMSTLPEGRMRLDGEQALEINRVDGTYTHALTTEFTQYGPNNGRTNSKDYRVNSLGYKKEVEIKTDDGKSDIGVLKGSNPNQFTIYLRTTGNTQYGTSELIVLSTYQRLD